MEQVDIREMTFQFALDIVDLYRDGVSSNEFVLSKQVLRSGTSIGANVEEAQAAQSKKDFTSMMAIASKEARETRYWLKLIKESKIFAKNTSLDDLIVKNDSIIRVLTKIVKTSSTKS
jgi:four helix bundle protein